MVSDVKVPIVLALLNWVVSYIGMLVSALKRTINLQMEHNYGYKISDLYIWKPVAVNDLVNHWLFTFNLAGYPKFSPKPPTA